ncbi:MAG: hypothetical protein ACE5PT_11590 [Gemmatimonadales bacterium]
MPPFIESVLQWASLTGNHFLFMFWWIWVLAVALTALSESFLFDPWRRRLLERPDDGWRTVWLAGVLGVLSPPSRRRMFAQARELLARGVSPAGVVGYLVSAQALFIWVLLLIVALNGPQPVIGLFIAVAAALVVLRYALSRMPERLWASARESAARGIGASGDAPAIGRTGPVWLQLSVSLGGQVYSLWWPLLVGLLGIGFFLALGQSEGYVSLQGSRGPLIQGGNAVVGLLVAHVTATPLAANALVAAGLWKPAFLTYAGLSAFYLGTLVMPFALPRYLVLLGVELGKQLLVWLVAAILVGALAATAWWWGLDWLAGAVGVRDWFEAFTASTLRPNDVPWFHHWFAPGL